MAKKKATKKAPAKRTAAKQPPAPKTPVAVDVPHDVRTRCCELAPHHFRSVIRLVKTANLDRVNQLRQATFNALKRLGVARDASKAVAGVPSGSDQHDLQSLFAWMNKIHRDDAEAIKQLVAIDATCVARSG